MPRKQAAKLDPNGLEKIYWERLTKNYPPNRSHYMTLGSSLTLCKAFDTASSRYLNDGQHRLTRDWRGSVICGRCLQLVTP